MKSAASASAPVALTTIAAQVNGCIAATLDEDFGRWVALDEDLAAPLAALRSLALAGGKRLRPAFCFWGFVGAGGDPEDPAVVRAGAALELLHIFALIHDDVMDDSPRRHDRDTLHVDFARRHRDASWRGDSDRFGDAVAILLGDQMFVYSDMLLGGASPEALSIFNELRLEVNVGQYLDLLGTVRGGTDVDAARRICRYKTAKYTVERPLHLGAALAGPQRLGELQQPLSAFGLPLGEAFQLRDDLLGVFGDPAVTGKPIGEDLREGKPTVLYALAKETADPAQRRYLEHRYGASDLDDDDIETLRGIFEATGAHTRLLQLIDRLVREALSAAEALAIQPAARHALIELVHFVAGRDH